MKRILLHGLGQDSGSWTATKNLLKFDVLCPNLFELINGEISYENLYSSFVSWISSFDDKFDICGLSLGGILALNYAKEYPDRVNSIIIVGTPFTIPKFQFTIQSVIFRCMPNKVFENIGSSKKDIILLTKSMRNIDIQIFSKGIKCKTLVLCGKRDGANSKYLDDFQATITDCKSEFMEDAGHEVNLDNPDVLAEKINDFWN